MTDLRAQRVCRQPKRAEESGHALNLLFHGQSFLRGYQADATRSALSKLEGPGETRDPGSAQQQPHEDPFRHAAAERRTRRQHQGAPPARLPVPPPQAAALSLLLVTAPPPARRSPRQPPKRCRGSTRAPAPRGSPALPGERSPRSHLAPREE